MTRGRCLTWHPLDLCFDRKIPYLIFGGWSNIEIIQVPGTYNSKRSYQEQHCQQQAKQKPTSRVAELNRRNRSRGRPGADRQHNKQKQQIIRLQQQFFRLCFDRSLNSVAGQNRLADCSNGKFRYFRSSTFDHIYPGV